MPEIGTVGFRCDAVVAAALYVGAARFSVPKRYAFFTCGHRVLPEQIANHLSG